MERCRCSSQPAYRRERDDQTLPKDSQSVLLREDGRECPQELCRDGREGKSKRFQNKAADKKTSIFFPWIITN